MFVFSFDAIFDQPKPRSKDNVVDGDGGFCLMEAQWSWVDKGNSSLVVHILQGKRMEYGSSSQTTRMEYGSLVFGECIKICTYAVFVPPNGCFFLKLEANNEINHAMCSFVDFFWISSITITASR